MLLWLQRHVCHVHYEGHRITAWMPFSARSAFRARHRTKTFQIAGHALLVQQVQQANVLFVQVGSSQRQIARPAGGARTHMRARLGNAICALMAFSRISKGPVVSPAHPDLLVGLDGALPVMSARCQLHGQTAVMQGLTVRRNVWLRRENVKTRGSQPGRSV